jgi:hypothetical protein
MIISLFMPVTPARRVRDAGRQTDHVADERAHDHAQHHHPHDRSVSDQHVHQQPNPQKPTISS